MKKRFTRTQSALFFVTFSIVRLFMPSSVQAQEFPVGGKLRGEDIVRMLSTTNSIYEIGSVATTRSIYFPDSLEQFYRKEWTAPADRRITDFSAKVNDAFIILYYVILLDNGDVYTMNPWSYNTQIAASPS